MRLTPAALAGLPRRDIARILRPGGRRSTTPWASRPRSVRANAEDNRDDPPVSVAEKREARNLTGNEALGDKRGDCV